MFIEIGPVSLTIRREKDGKPCDFHTELLTKRIHEILHEIRECLPLLRLKAYKVKNTKHLPYVPKKMVEAVKSIHEESLTPMAAVAGSVADVLKEFLMSEGVDLVSVNNGGDVSVFNKTGRDLTIDIGDICTGQSSPYVLKIDRLIDYGVATSGFGGRSFTLGLADSVTVIAGTGAVADAAATFICNSTNVESNRVIRQKASEIDPLSDIPDDYVTVKINKLDDHDISTALENGLNIARMLKKQYYTLDTIIQLQGHMVTTMNGDNPIRLEVLNGN